MEKNPNQSETPLSKKEEVKKVFSKFDPNGDDNISSAELGAVFNGLGSETSAEEVARMMSELDHDGDDYVDLTEFKSFHYGGDENKEKELKEAFDLYDKDKNRNISATELHVALMSLGEDCSIKDYRRMISSCDVDGDGCINYEEFKKMMTSSSSYA
ncbi:hypothetical protein DH2020_046827 [Rehmannia glutinosa]|uniref:EF-hand domain-containing protein n=1 Tax=Rehmannia glutinosa TaxID=99300 RepID=A0ABR0UAU9_REHGL